MKYWLHGMMFDMSCLSWTQSVLGLKECIG